jgi:hypothetical protein
MLIFDSFPTLADAQSFANFVERKGLYASVHTRRADSDLYDPFPYELYPPIVLVERHEDEKYIEKAVRSFGGKFAGT